MVVVEDAVAQDEESSREYLYERSCFKNSAANTPGTLYSLRKGMKQST